MALYILAIFLHSMPQKLDQGTLGTHRLTPIGSRIHLGRPSLGPGPALVLQWTLTWTYNTPSMALYEGSRQVLDPIRWTFRSPESLDPIFVAYNAKI